MSAERPDRPARHAKVGTNAQRQRLAHRELRGLRAPKGNLRLVRKQAEIVRRGPTRALRRISQQVQSADAPRRPHLDPPVNANRAVRLVRQRAATARRIAEPRVRAGQPVIQRVRAALFAERTGREPTRHAGRMACAARQRRTALAARSPQHPGATNRRGASGQAAAEQTRPPEIPNRAPADLSARRGPAPRAQTAPSVLTRSP